MRRVLFSSSFFFILLQWLFVRRSFHIHSIQDFSPFWLECVQIKSLASIHIFYRTFPFASFGWRIRNRFKRILYGFIYISIENLSGTADYKSYFVHVPSSHLPALPLTLPLSTLPLFFFLCTEMCACFLFSFSFLCCSPCQNTWAYSFSASMCSVSQYHLVLVYWFSLARSQNSDNNEYILIGGHKTQYGKESENKNWFADVQTVQMQQFDSKMKKKWAKNAQWARESLIIWINFKGINKQFN